MPNKTERLPQNVAGAFYVDSSCVDCDMCRVTAPDFFKRDDAVGLSFVHIQPTTPQELAMAREAIDGCPSSSIGDDGEP